MNRTVQYTAAMVITVIVGAVFYYAFVHPALQVRPDTSTEQPQTVVPEAIHPLTGLAVATSTDFYVASVMFDNFETVRNRPGLEQASIVYEALAEGGITRIMGVFDTSVELKRFGPIRSVRPYFIDWAAEYGGIVMHVGGSPEALAQLKQSDDLIDVDQIGAREIYFERDESIKAPHNVFSSYSSWLQIKDRLKPEMTKVRPWHYATSTTSQLQGGTRQVDILYSPDAKVSWVYNAEKDTYVRFVNGMRQVAATGEPVMTTNLIVIEVPSETIDSIGRQRMKTLGRGPVRIFRSGQELNGSWLKETRSTRMRFIGDDQEELALNPGVSWVAAVPSLDLVSYTTSE